MSGWTIWPMALVWFCTDETFRSSRMSQSRSSDNTNSHHKLPKNSTKTVCHVLAACLRKNTTQKTFPGLVTSAWFSDLVFRVFKTPGSWASSAGTLLALLAYLTFHTHGPLSAKRFLSLPCQDE